MASMIYFLNIPRNLLVHVTSQESVDYVYVLEVSIFSLFLRFFDLILELFLEQCCCFISFNL